MLMEELAKEFILDCRVRNLAPRTIRNYEKQLSYFVRFLNEGQGVKELEELKPIHIKQFIVMLQGRQNKPSYINDLLKAVKCLCAYAYRTLMIGASMIIQLRRLPRLKRYQNDKSPQWFSFSTIVRKEFLWGHTVI